MAFKKKYNESYADHLITPMMPLTLLGRTGISWIDHLGASTIFFGSAFLKVLRCKQLAKIIQQAKGSRLS